MSPSQRLPDHPYSAPAKNDQCSLSLNSQHTQYLSAIAEDSGIGIEQQSKGISEAADALLMLFQSVESKEVQFKQLRHPVSIATPMISAIFVLL